MITQYNRQVALNVNDEVVVDSVEVINPRATSHAFSNNENNDTIEVLHIDESANALENSLCHQQIANCYELSQVANLIESVEECIGKLPLIETSKSSVNVANKMSTQSSAHRVKDSSQVNRLTERLREVGLYDNITQQKGEIKTKCKLINENKEWLGRLPLIEPPTTRNHVKQPISYTKNGQLQNRGSIDQIMQSGVNSIIDKESPTKLGDLVVKLLVTSLSQE